MVGIVKHVPSHSRMLPLAEAFQASDFNLHAYPFFFCEVQLSIPHCYSRRKVAIMKTLSSSLERPAKCSISFHSPYKTT